MLWSSARPLGLRTRRLVGITCSQLPQVSCSWRYCSHHPNLLITSYLILKPSAEVFSPNLGGPLLRSFIFFVFVFFPCLLFYLHPNMGVTGVGQLEPRPQFGHHPQRMRLPYAYRMSGGVAWCGSRPLYQHFGPARGDRMEGGL